MSTLRTILYIPGYLTETLRNMTTPSISRRKNPPPRASRCLYLAIHGHGMDKPDPMCLYLPISKKPFRSERIDHRKPESMQSRECLLFGTYLTADILIRYDQNHDIIFGSLQSPLCHPILGFGQGSARSTHHVETAN